MNKLRKRITLNSEELEMKTKLLKAISEVPKSQYILKENEEFFIDILKRYIEYLTQYTNGDFKLELLVKYGVSLGEVVKKTVEIEGKTSYIYYVCNELNPEEIIGERFSRHYYEYTHSKDIVIDILVAAFNIIEIPKYSMVTKYNYELVTDGRNYDGLIRDLSIKLEPIWLFGEMYKNICLDSLFYFKKYYGEFTEAINYKEVFRYASTVQTNEIKEYTKAEFDTHMRYLKILFEECKLEKKRNVGMINQVMVYHEI